MTDRDASNGNQLPTTEAGLAVVDGYYVLVTGMPYDQYLQKETGDPNWRDWDDFEAYGGFDCIDEQEPEQEPEQEKKTFQDCAQGKQTVQLIDCDVPSNEEVRKIIEDVPVKHLKPITHSNNQLPSFLQQDPSLIDTEVQRKMDDLRRWGDKTTAGSDGTGQSLLKQWSHFDSPWVDRVTTPDPMTGKSPYDEFFDEFEKIHKPQYKTDWINFKRDASNKPVSKPQFQRNIDPFQGYQSTLKNAMDKWHQEMVPDFQKPVIQPNTTTTCSTNCAGFQQCFTKDVNKEVPWTL